MRGPGARRFGLLALLTGVAVLGLSSIAGAAQLIVGQTTLDKNVLHKCTSTSGYNEVQISTTGGDSYAVPIAGVLTSWSTSSGVAGSISLAIYRPAGKEFRLIATDGPRLVAANTFPASFPIAIPIPVLPGDRVGLAVPTEASDCLIETTQKGDVVAWQSGNMPVGATTTLEPSRIPETRLNISASLLPAPTVATVSPASGSVAGAAATITGTNFAAVSAVTFGGVPVAGFRVDSEGQITATVPAGRTLGPVPVVVTTAAGSAAGSFTYEGCRVPKLKGRKLKGSRKAASRSDCALGKVTKRKGATTKTGKVVAQTPKPGSVLPPDGKIKVTLKPPA